MDDVSAESGTVISISGDRAVVHLHPHEACEHCNARILCRPNTEGLRELQTVNRVGATIGQRVEINETGNLLLLLSFMQFGLPLLGMIVGIFALNLLDLSRLPLAKELVLTFGGLCGLFMGGFLARIWSSRTAKNTNCAFEITSILS